MADLEESDVRRMARNLGFSLTDDDITEVTHRLNAFIDALRPLADLDHTAVEPVPAAVDPDAEL